MKLTSAFWSVSGDWMEVKLDDSFLSGYNYGYGNTINRNFDYVVS